MKRDAHQLASNKVVNRPSVSLPFQDERRTPASNTPPDQAEVLTSTKRSTDKMAISKRQTSTSTRSPLLPVTYSLPKPPPARTVPPRPSNDETKPPSKVVSKTIQQPVKKIAVSNKQTSAKSHSPVPVAAVKMAVGTVSTRATPSRPSIDKSIQKRTAPRTLQPVKSSAVINKRVTSTTSRPPSFPMPTTHFPLIRSIRIKSSRKAGKEPELPIPVAAKQRTVKTDVATISSAEDQWPAPLQVRFSKFPGGMREERRTAYVANEINKGEAVSRLPKSAAILASPILPSPQTLPIPPLEPSMVPTLLIPVSLPVLHCLFHESTSAAETVAEQRANDVVSKDKTNVSENSPEDSTPVPLSAHQAQTMPPCQDQDKVSLPVEATPTRSSLHDIKVKKSKPSREDEGLYLSRAATYI